MATSNKKNKGNLTMPLFIPYVVLSLAVAIFGANRKFGFWGYFFGALLLTPAIGLILVLASDRTTD